EDVTIVYRRGADHMGATHHEQDLAQTSGVRIRHWAQPVRLVGEGGRVREVELERTRLDGTGRLTGTGERFRLAADQVFKAIGQVFVPAPLAKDSAEPLEIAGGRIAVNEDRQTSLPGVYAGGDCVAGLDLTVRGVEDGKVAAHAIDRYLRS